MTIDYLTVNILMICGNLQSEWLYFKNIWFPLGLHCFNISQEAVPDKLLIIKTFNCLTVINYIVEHHLTTNL